MSRHSVSVCLFMCLATLLLFPLSASSQTSDWTFCAAEGGVCAFTGTQEVRYGANGSYFSKTLSDGTSCTNSVFGDPVEGTTKSCAVRVSDWTFCAVEGGVCAFADTQEVRYGANGSYFSKTLSGSTACTNSVFGDPIPGTVKQCAVGTTTASEWTLCAWEGGVCSFAGTQEVRFGANGSYTYLKLSGASPCANSMFGDPVPGVAKRCDIRTVSGLPSGWTATDVGAPSLTGSTQYASGTYTLEGAGEIGVQPGGTTDQFRFVYRQITGDVEIRARVMSIENTNQWSKAGVMLRETLASNSVMGITFISGGSVSAFQRRVTTGGSRQHVDGPTVAVPRWVRLERRGALVTSSQSSDGVTWATISTMTLSAPTLYVGLAVTSATTSTLATGVFDNVVVEVPATNNQAPTVTMTAPAIGAPSSRRRASAWRPPRATPMARSRKSPSSTAPRR